jgi:hypothetical protein
VNATIHGKLTNSKRRNVTKWDMVLYRSPARTELCWLLGSDCLVDPFNFHCLHGREASCYYHPLIA